jgi:NADPH:quinone reductase-like Zn-dependent oxidoreductase
MLNNFFELFALAVLVMGVMAIAFRTFGIKQRSLTSEAAIIVCMSLGIALAQTVSHGLADGQRVAIVACAAGLGYAVGQLIARRLDS